MTEIQTNSWIFLAIAIASQKEPVDIKGISQIADGINHAVPTQKELKSSINWLINSGYIKAENSKYTLTKKGMIDYNFASTNTNILLNIWRNLERQLK
ncbi:MAG: hypothetical protein ABUT20_48305 [Bacteroidota bacterium]